MCKTVFGITGATGTGKSTVSEILRECGADVIDADRVSREVACPGSECLCELTEHFGREILLEDGSLNRRKLGGIVFGDEKKLSVLTQITHKYIKQRIIELIAQSKSRLCGIDGAVLIGSSMESLCEFMISVIADTPTRLKRIMNRDNISEAYAKKRILSQPDPDFYISHSDYVIENNGTYADLAKKTKLLYDDILKNRISS